MGGLLGKFGPKLGSLVFHEVRLGLLANSRPEDILGSVEVDGKGEIIGNYQSSGTYRVVTNEGM